MMSKARAAELTNEMLINKINEFYAKLGAALAEAKSRVEQANLSNPENSIQKPTFAPLEPTDFSHLQEIINQTLALNEPISRPLLEALFKLLISNELSIDNYVSNPLLLEGYARLWLKMLNDMPLTLPEKALKEEAGLAKAQRNIEMLNTLQPLQQHNIDHETCIHWFEC